MKGVLSIVEPVDVPVKETDPPKLTDDVPVTCASPVPPAKTLKADG